MVDREQLQYRSHTVTGWRLAIDAQPLAYNLFTDLAPGLFTHVGVLAWEEGTDGVRRLVVVDLPERGTKIPATNVDLFLQRTLNYVFLRHKDPQVAAQMGQAAADCIGNPSELI